MTRADGRSFDAIRPITIETGFQKFPEGSVLYRCGVTRVLCSASIDDSLPGWLRGKGKGWIKVTEKDCKTKGGTVVADAKK